MNLQTTIEVQCNFKNPLKKVKNMKTTIFDVPAGLLIDEVAQELGKIPALKKPEFLEFVKTGKHREQAPHRKDWFWVRMASILYRVYKDGPVGTEQLRTYYGGRQNRGVRPHKFAKASGKIIRLCLQNLETAGLVQKAKKGRAISPAGQSLLSKKASALYPQLEERAKQIQEHRETRAKERVARDKETKTAGLPSRKPIHADSHKKESKPGGKEAKHK